MYTKKNLPKSQHELTTGIEDKRFGRSNDIKDDSAIKELSIGLYDHDYAIKWYFDNVIKPEIDSFGTKVQVPVMFGSPEKWKNMQKDGYFRDKSGKIQSPIISYRRTSITKNKTLSSKIDANFPQLYNTQEVKYGQKNRYDQFSVLTAVQPTKAYINTVIPEFVDITYDVIVWTDFIEHMNNIVESILYTEGSFWGQPDSFKFRTKIDSFTNTTDLLQDQDRTVRTAFTLTVYGYIIPKGLAKGLSKKQSLKSYKAKQLSIRTTPDADSSVFQQTETNNIGAGSTMTNDAPPPTPAVTSEIPLDLITYLNTNITKQNSTINPPNIAIFNATMLAAPPNIMPTSASSFLFFINGTLVEPTAITSFVENNNGTCVLTINTSELGFTLAQEDEIIAIGKFN